MASVGTESRGSSQEPCRSLPFQRSLKRKMLPTARHHQPLTPGQGTRTPEGGWNAAGFSPGTRGVTHGTPPFPLGRQGPTVESGEGQDHGHRKWEGSHRLGQRVPASPPRARGSGIWARRGRAPLGVVSVPLAPSPLPPSAPGPAPAVTPSLRKRRQPAELRGLSFPRPASVPGRPVPVRAASS